MESIIYNEDCILGMKKLENDIADIIIADPPYNIGKDFGNNTTKKELSEYVRWCEEWISECLRILKPSGTLYIYGFIETLSYLQVYLQPLDQKIKCHTKIIHWHYTNKTVPSLKFWQRSHESILVCNKDIKQRIFNRDDVREEYTKEFLASSAGKTRPATKGRFGNKETVYNANPNGALPRDIIKGISTLAGGGKERNDGESHPTQKPILLCEKLIKACVNKEIEENLIVVPFAGSGSEIVSAKKMNVNYIGYEINNDYINIINNRLEKLKN